MKKKKHLNEIEIKDTGLIIIAIVSLLIITGLWFFTFIKLKDLEPIDRGTFGDMFGSINALFSGLALAGIILTILLQRKELSLQRLELKDTREELTRTANAQEKSEIALNKQAENLKISAKLTALNTLLVFYSDLETKMATHITDQRITDVRNKKDNYLKRIEELLEIKEMT